MYNFYLLVELYNKSITENLTRMNLLHITSFFCFILSPFLTNAQQPNKLVDQNDSIRTVPSNSAVNILLNDSIHLTQKDTNWVELEMEILISESQLAAKLAREPKANTILETLPYNPSSKVLGVDFDNTLFINKDRIPSAVPIYEQPALVLISSGKIIKSSQNNAVEQNEVDDEWSEYSEKIQPEITDDTIFSSKGITSSEAMGFTDLVEQNYHSYKITKKTSLRQNATASSKVLKRLKVGTELKVIDQVDRYWCKAILNGQEGYVKVLLLEKVE